MTCTFCGGAGHERRDCAELNSAIEQDILAFGEETVVDPHEPFVRAKRETEE